MRIHFIAIPFGIGLVVWGGQVPAAAGVPSRPDWFSRVCATGIASGTAGDVNGDGYDDAIVANAGIACVYRGSAQGLSHRPAWVVPVFSEFSDASAGTAGDVNGDGYDDVIIGADPMERTTRAACTCTTDQEPGLSGSPTGSRMERGTTTTLAVP